MSEKTVVGFGEVMLRLCPPGKQRFGQALPGSLQATFGGGEANVCVSLATLGMSARYLTALPDNPIAQAFISQLRGIGVGSSRILLKKDGRMGVYYAEHGAAQRGSNVIYDREGSVVSQCGPEDYDFAAMLAGASHLHVTGITPALSEKAFLTTLEIVRTARKLGMSISCDLNYRKKLWKWRPGTKQRDLAGECMGQIVPEVDIIIGNEEDAADVFGLKAAGSAIESGSLSTAGYVQVAQKLAARFPKAKYIGITLRESFSADHNNWGAMLYDCEAKKTYFAPLDITGQYSPYEIRNIIDRFGGGDSFCAGLIYALHHDDFKAPQTALSFAVAASCLKHSIPGDYNFSTLAEVVALMGGNASGRVMR
ncbi:MAG: sugar kinase [Lentisphaerae bacterium]|nr:sugar kinase [Lentisphaerota bacterium]